jgi:hypothetical protein
VIFEVNAGPNLLQGTIPDVSACRVFNTQGIKIIAGVRKQRFSGSTRR